MAYLGIDPGKSGALALIGRDGLTLDWIGLNETEHDVAKFIELYRPMIDLAVLERVGARPGNGAASMFKFGQSYGFCIGLLTAAKIRYQIHTPTKWQRALGLVRPKLSRTEKKKINKSMAQRLFMGSPKITNRNADAFLLAEYARRIEHGGENGKAKLAP